MFEPPSVSLTLSLFLLERDTVVFLNGCCNNNNYYYEWQLQPHQLLLQPHLLLLVDIHSAHDEPSNEQLWILVGWLSDRLVAWLTLLSFLFSPPLPLLPPLFFLQLQSLSLSRQKPLSRPLPQERLPVSLSVVSTFIARISISRF